MPMIINRKKYYTKINMAGGWLYNEHIDFSKELLYEAQTAPGACYLVKTEIARKIKFEEERWLELTSFSLPDDQINFYKYYKLGYKIGGISNIHILHLDGGDLVMNVRKKQFMLWLNIISFFGIDLFINRVLILYLD